MNQKFYLLPLNCFPLVNIDSLMLLKKLGSCFSASGNIERNSQPRFEIWHAMFSSRKRNFSHKQMGSSCASGWGRNGNGSSLGNAEDWSSEKMAKS